MAISKGRVNRVRENWKCILICFAMSMANCQFGYDTAAVAGFQAMKGFLQVYGYKDSKSPTGWNIATEPQQLISSLLNVGTIIGVVLTATWAKRFGRRPAIWAATLIAFIAAGVQIGTTNLVGIYFGRILIGVSNGFYLTFANVYTAEVSPPHLRGAIVSFFGIWISFGSIMGAIANYFSKDYVNKLCYQIPLAVFFAIPTVLSILVCFIPESPRWLLVRNKPTEARVALERLRGTSFKNHPELLEEEFQEMKRGIEEEKELITGSSIKDMFKGTDLRRTLLCFAAIVSHSSSGNGFVVGYATFFFQMAGYNHPFLATILKSVCGLVGVIICIFLTQRFLGRRPMMLIGHGFPALFMLGTGLADTVAPKSVASGKAIVACILLFQAFYNGFSGTISWVIASEVSSSRLRILTVGTANGLHYLFSWLTTFTTPYFINPENLNWGAKYGYIWAGSNLLTFSNLRFVFFYFFLPEMKGRSLEELDEMFQNRVSVRDFPKYECVSSEKAKEAAMKVVEDIKSSTVIEETTAAVHAEEA